MIALRGLALRRGERELFSGADLLLQDGCKAGVVGRNGCGKSSLFAALTGELDCDAGSIDLPNGLRISTVAQETPALAQAAIDYVLGGDTELAAVLAEQARAEHEDDHAAQARVHQRLDELGGYDGRARAGRLLHGLGFAADDGDRSVGDFSGGWRVRLNLARALMAPSDLLLLDEPTNHLDLDTVLWLQDWLKRYPGMLLAISHDRDFLDAVCGEILHVHDQRLTLYRGNYSSFERQRAEALRQQQIRHVREQEERVKLQAFIDRFKAKASKARQAQSRAKQLERLAGTEAVRLERPFHFRFAEPERLPQSMLQLDRVSAGYRADDGTVRTVLDEVMLRIEAGDRIGLLGANGAGKSTVVKTVVGQLPALSGTRTAHKDLRVGYFAQHTVESLAPGSTPLGLLRAEAGQASEQELRNWLGQWHFAGDRAVDPVEQFSGGERARLALALIAWRKPNLLVLDEPTNHLDLDLREALSEALNEYAGALVLVAHDRHLLNLACDSFRIVVDGRLEEFDGDLDDYAAWLRTRSGAASGQAGGDAAAGAETARARRQQAARQRASTGPLRKRLRAIENRLAAIDAELEPIEAQLADPKFYRDQAEQSSALVRQSGRLRVEREGLEEEWLVVGEELQSATS